MPVPRVCLPFAAAALCRSAGDATEDGERTSSKSACASSGSDSSGSSDPPSSSSAASASGQDDSSASLVTLPSLPSLQSLAPFSFTAAPHTAAFVCLSSFHQAQASVSVSAAALAASPSSFLLYAASEAEIVVYDLRSLRRVDSFAAALGAGAVKSVALLPDGRVLTAHQDRRVRLWRQSRPGRPHRFQASLPTTSDRLRHLPLPGSYVTVRRHRRRLWIEHADAVSAVAAGKDAIYTASWDKTLKVWRASDLRCTESVAAHDDAVNAVAVAADGTVYTGSADRRIRVWAREPGGRHSLVATLERHRSAVNALALSADEAVLYSGACDRSIIVWEREDSAGHMAVAGALRGHARAILSLACAGDLLFSGSADRTVRIWRRGGDGRGYSCLGVMEGHVRGVRSLVAFKSREPGDEKARRGGDGAEDEYRVCSGSLDGEVRIWHVRLSSEPTPTLVEDE